MQHNENADAIRSCNWLQHGCSQPAQPGLSFACHRPSSVLCSSGVCACRCPLLLQPAAALAQTRGPDTWRTGPAQPDSLHSPRRAGQCGPDSPDMWPGQPDMWPICGPDGPDMFWPGPDGLDMWPGRPGHVARTARTRGPHGPDMWPDGRSPGCPGCPGWVLCGKCRVGGG